MIAPDSPPKRPLDTLVRDSLAPRREALRLIGAFSLLALALAAVGGFGVLAGLARERSREFGVRLALGARPAQLGALVLGEGLAFAVPGSALGLAGAAAAGRALGALLHGISPADPVARGGSSGPGHRDPAGMASRTRGSFDPE